KLTQLINAYVDIDADQAFSILEPLTARLSDVSEAAVVFYSFQEQMNVKEGEYSVNQGAFGFYFDPSLFQRLAAKDLDRTLKLIDGFSRREMRVWAKLSVADGLQNKAPSVSSQNQQLTNSH